MRNADKQLEIVKSNAGEKKGSSITSSIIPKSFWLGGLKIDVHYDDSLCEIRRVIGEARYSAQSIMLDPTVSGQQQVEQAYYHELVHWILFIMNETELRNNEKFVDLFAHFLYQARVTEGSEVLSTR